MPTDESTREADRERAEEVGLPVEEYDPEGETIGLDALTKLLAEATGTTPEEIERGANELIIEPPEDADWVSITSQPGP